MDPPQNDPRLCRERVALWCSRELLVLPHATTQEGGQEIEVRIERNVYCNHFLFFSSLQRNIGRNVPSACIH